MTHRLLETRETLQQLLMVKGREAKLALYLSATKPREDEEGAPILGNENLAATVSHLVSAKEIALGSKVEHMKHSDALKVKIEAFEEVFSFTDYNKFINNQDPQFVEGQQRVQALATVLAMLDEELYSDKY